MEEISREVILEARKKGIEHLFVSSPILFSEILLEKRIQQFFVHVRFRTFIQLLVVQFVVTRTQIGTHAFWWFVRHFQTVLQHGDGKFGFWH